MKIESVTIKNFRTLKDLKVYFDSYYSAISGKNNAGKTTLIKVIRTIFRGDTHKMFPFREDQDIEYEEDKTQWETENPDIELEYVMSVSSQSDPGLFTFVEKLHERKIESEKLALTLNMSYSKDGASQCTACVDGAPLGDYESNEILQKLKSSDVAFLHNSTQSDIGVVMSSKARMMFHELMLSPDEKRELAEAQKRVQNKVKKLAKSHKEELVNLLGHLEDKYDVEFTIPEAFFSRTMPFGINLTDKNVEVPLSEWGSGTKNRTQILMSILHANRIKTKDDSENKITPVIIIEEPESFLHPSAQAEFGRVLRELASDLGIQTIVTTHSPYMLSQENPKSNILLDRKEYRGKLKESYVVEIDERTWMEPFSEILGLDNSEFSNWRDVILSNTNRVLLVEGEIDKEYFSHIQSLKIDYCSLPSGIEIVPYGGKDSLKNSILLKFILDKFDHVFITFDLDAKQEVEKHLQRVGLQESKHYCAVGLPSEGKDCIEGLVPQRTVAKVHGENTDLVMQFASQDNKVRVKARDALKKKVLEEFKNTTELTKTEMKGFQDLFKAISSAFA
jgi:predicted ATP-dependent endonuclease of OLD family